MNRGRRVSREDLATAVWKDFDPPDDFQPILHTLVWQIKTALKKHAAEELANIIVPVTKFGYCVTSDGPGEISPDSGTGIGEGLQRRDQLALQSHFAGLRHFEDRTIESLVKAKDLFERAHRENSKFASALCRMADCLFLLGTCPFATFDPLEAFPKARTHAQESLRLATIESDIASARTTLAAVQMLFDWDWRGAEEAFLGIIADHPLYGRPRQFYAHLLLFTGRSDKALREIAAATRLEPASPMILMTEGLIQYFAQQYEHAQGTFSHTVELYPRFAPAHYWVGVLCERFGEREKAIAAFEQSFEIDQSPVPLAGLGHLYARTNEHAALQTTLARLTRVGVRLRVSSWFYAIIYAGACEEDRVREYLEAAVDERCDSLLHVELEPRFERYRRRPWLRDIVKATLESPMRRSRQA
jgi:tetratricopeptide (TPR) repeat protein